MSPFSRREFLKTSLAVGTIGSVSALPLHAAPATASDLVTLGKSGLQVTRLAFGTGSNNGEIQAALGQKEFSRLIHYAYDRGIRFFETAEAYLTPAMLGEALKPFPRDSYQLMTKVTTDEGADPKKRFDEMRRTSNTEYFDIMLLHWQHTPTWVAETGRWQDGILEAQAQNIIRVRGASVHGLPALRQMPGNPWLEVAMIRMNHNGTRMDGPIDGDYIYPDCVSEVVDHVKQVKRQGMGVISMKLVGNSAFTRHEDRQTAMRFAFAHAGVDCAAVGFKSTPEIDEAIDNMNLALA
ncbi:MAG: aldo/keto reductase [Terracidiphilus sp.]|jgi:aryl-alcohol dehydrogenase-like predicted oxidoreductase